DDECDGRARVGQAPRLSSHAGPPAISTVLHTMEYPRPAPHNGARRFDGRLTARVDDPLAAFDVLGRLVHLGGESLRVEPPAHVGQGIVVVGDLDHGVHDLWPGGAVDAAQRGRLAAFDV